MKSTRERNEKFLARHADEIDELLRDANEVLGMTATTNTDSAATERKGQKERSDGRGSSSKPALRPSVISYSSYENLTSCGALVCDAALVAQQKQQQQQQQMVHPQQLAMVRLKPLGGGDDSGGPAPGSAQATSAVAGTKQLQKAQRQERQWYKQNVLEPSLRQEREAAARAEAERAAARAAAEAQDRDAAMLRPLDPARFSLLRGTSGSLLPEARSGHAVAAFDDALYLFGGFSQQDQQQSHQSAVTGIPSADLFVCSGLGSAHGVQWGPAFCSGPINAPKPSARAHHTMTLFKQRASSDAALFVFGGMAPSVLAASPMTTTGVANSPLSSSSAAAAAAAARTLNDVQESTTTFFDDAWIYLIGEQRWRRIGHEALNNSSPPSGRFGHSCVMLHSSNSENEYDDDGGQESAFVFGGRVARKSDPTASKVCADLFILEGSSSYTRWTKLPAPSNSIINNWPCARYHHAAAVASIDADRKRSMRMFVHGGIDGKGNALHDLWVFDARARVWREVQGMSAVASVPRSRHAMVGLTGGRVMLVGGLGPTDAAAASAALAAGNATASAIASSACLVVAVGPDVAAVAPPLTARSEQQQQQQRLIVLTLLEQPFVGFPQPHMCLHSFGGCAVSNGAAFVVSPAAAGSTAVAVHRFALPAASTASLTPPSSSSATALFSLWCARRLNRSTAPVPHDVELSCVAPGSAPTSATAAIGLLPLQSPARGGNSSSTATATGAPPSVFCHKSILQMRAPHLWNAISSNCVCVSRQMGTGNAEHWIAKYELVGRSATTTSSSAGATTTTTTTMFPPLGGGQSLSRNLGGIVGGGGGGGGAAAAAAAAAVTAGHGRRHESSAGVPADGLSAAPVGFFSGASQLLAAVVYFLYRGVLPENEACRVAGGDAQMADMLLGFAKAYRITSLVAAIGVLAGGAPAQHAAKRAAAERSGVVAAVDDVFSAVSGFTTPGDVTLVVADPLSSSGTATETLHVHAAVVACASPVLRKLLVQGGGGGVTHGGAVASGDDGISVQWSSTTIKQKPMGGDNEDNVSQQQQQRSGFFVERKATIHGLRLPIGPALRAVVEHMYSGNTSSPAIVTPDNALEVSFAATKLGLTALRAAAEQVLMRDAALLSAPPMDASMRDLCAALSLSLRYECGSIVEALSAAAAVRIAEMDSRVFHGELPLALKVDILQLARSVYFSSNPAVSMAPRSSAGTSVITVEQSRVDSLEKELMAKEGDAVRELIQQRANISVMKQNYDSRAAAALFHQ